MHCTDIYIYIVVVMMYQNIMHFVGAGGGSGYKTSISNEFCMCTI